MTRVRHMKRQQQGALIGALVADSLAMPVHWIYDTEQIVGQFSKVENLLPPPTTSYHAGKSQGDLTHYGDQTLLLARNVIVNKNSFDIKSFSLLWQQSMQAYQGYMDRASKTTLENMAQNGTVFDCGSGSTDLGGAVRIAALMGLMQGTEREFQTAAKLQTACTHNSVSAIEGTLFLLRCCLAIFQGSSPQEAIVAALDHGVNDIDLDLRLRTAASSKDLTVTEAVKQFGRGCNISSALPGAIYAILKYQHDFKAAVIETVMAGGDSAARGMAVGMLLGAWLGTEELPEEWFEGLNCFPELTEMFGGSALQVR